MLMLVLAILLVIALIAIARCIVIVPQSNGYVTEWLGVYKDTWEAGLHIRTPFVERVARRVSLKEEVADFPPQPVITRDNVTMMIDTVVFFQVFDPKAYAYGVSRPVQAIENLSATTLRDVIGSMSLDETLTSRDAINTKITATLDDATDRWGIKVNRVELKNIEPPTEIRTAMEKQMKAEREKRSNILLAEGEKQAAITRAEGEKESAILRAEAVKEQRIREAEGEAQALLMVQKAKAETVRLLNEAAPTQNMLALRSMEAMERVADGKATKIIVPSEMQNLAATVASIQGIAGGNTTPAATK
ncbi:MAG: SPFH/Band 7/PHB domain protein [Gemmiger sp.]|nr:SPFH/Band 7/PHB domain protein [Gemmiger sp.]